jgi:hypothetical protein
MCRLTKIREQEVVKELGTIKKKPSALHLDNRKDALRAAHEFAIPHAFQDQGCKGVSTHL